MKMSKIDTTEYNILLQLLTDIVTEDVDTSPSLKGGDELGKVA
jgi:hypothetical protein